MKDEVNILVRKGIRFAFHLFFVFPIKRNRIMFESYKGKSCLLYTSTVTAKVARKDDDGKRVKEVKDGKKVTVYDEVQKTIKKDQPSRLHARRQMLKVLYPVTEVRCV